jgi:hypothetical protein
LAGKASGSRKWAALAGLIARLSWFAGSYRPAATPACGDNCFALSSLVLGPDLIQNAYIEGDLGTGGRVGQRT